MHSEDWVPFLIYTKDQISQQLIWIKAQIGKAPDPIDRGLSPLESVCKPRGVDHIERAA